MSSLTILFILIGVLVVSVIIILILFTTRTAPFNRVYKYIDPRTGEPVSSNQEWKYPLIDYSPYITSVPSSNVQTIYNDLLISFGLEPVDYYNFS